MWFAASTERSSRTAAASASLQAARADSAALAGELRRFAADHAQPAAVQLEVLFTPAFPNAPPFVRVVSPRFAFIAAMRSAAVLPPSRSQICPTSASPADQLR